MKKFPLLLALIPSLALAKKPAPENLGPPSQAVTNKVLDAIAEEMNRQMQNLVIPGAPKPYSISYKITEVDVNDVAVPAPPDIAAFDHVVVSLDKVADSDCWNKVSAVGLFTVR